MIILFPKWFFFLPACISAEPSPQLCGDRSSAWHPSRGVCAINFEVTLFPPISDPSERVSSYIASFGCFSLWPVFLRKSLLHHRFLTKKGCSIESCFSTLLQWMKTVAKKRNTTCTCLKGVRPVMSIPNCDRRASNYWQRAASRARQCNRRWRWLVSRQGSAACSRLLDPTCGLTKS